MPKPNRATTTEPQNARVKTQNSGQHPSRENLLAEKQPSWRDDMMIEGKGYMLEKARQHKLTDNEAPGIEEAYDKWADVPRTDWCCVSLLRMIGPVNLLFCTYSVLCGDVKRAFCASSDVEFKFRGQDARKADSCNKVACCGCAKYIASELFNFIPGVKPVRKLMAACSFCDCQGMDLEESYSLAMQAKYYSQKVSQDAMGRREGYW